MQSENGVSVATHDPEWLPTGYEVKQQEGGARSPLYVSKDGKALRQASTGKYALPKYFRHDERAKAIQYARRHADLGLDMNQQVPNSGY